MRSLVLGYACINNTLAANDVVVNRSMMKRTLVLKGISYASALALKNVTDLLAVLKWNIAHEISFYRMSSDMFPWMSEYELHDLPDLAEISKALAIIGKLVADHNHRLTFHPGPFNVLASPNGSVISKTIKELRQHGEIMDMMSLARNPFAKINIHVGGAYGDKINAMKRFVTNFEKLPDSARLRLTIENDDKATMFSVNDLMTIHSETGIPIVFDYLHHQFCTGGLHEEEAFHLACSTWPANIPPVVHYSSAKRKFEDAKAVEAAHADYIYEPINTYGKNVSVMLEAKAKEDAILRYRKEFVEITTN
ncbi:MAG TPA: UV DNA damage repair endonuclease UvsE [Chryseosolibacter sp.]